MKKVFLFLAFFGAFALAGASAQCCQKKSAAAGTEGCAMKTASVDKACCAGKPCAATKMASAAKADPTIEARLDPNGSTVYVRKEDANGTVRLVDVKFDEPTGKFVNVAPGTANVAPAASTSGLVKKEAACTVEEKKACSSGEKKAGCCAKKAATSTNGSQK